MDHGQFYSALSVVWVFGFVAVLLIAWHLRNKRRLEKLSMIHDERMKAMEKGIPLPEFPEFEDGEVKTRLGNALADHVAGRRLNPRWPLGLGAVLVMGGIGMSIAGVVSGIKEADEFWAFGIIVISLGVGMFLYYALTRRRDES